MHYLKAFLGTIWVIISLVVVWIVFKLLPAYVEYVGTEQHLYLAGGVGAYGALHFLVPRKTFIFFDVFFHELSHGIFSLITFSTLRSFVVSPHAPRGDLGHVEHVCSRKPAVYFMRSHLISLAPYFFSPLTAVFLGLYALLSPYAVVYETTTNVLLSLIGFSYPYHVTISFADMRPDQSDFSYLGFKYSVLFVIMMQLLFFLLMIMILSNHYHSFYRLKHLWQEGVFGLHHLIQVIF